MTVLSDAIHKAARKMPLTPEEQRALNIWRAYIRATECPLPFADTEGDRNLPPPPDAAP